MKRQCSSKSKPLTLAQSNAIQNKNQQTIFSSILLQKYPILILKIQKYPISKKLDRIKIAAETTNIFRFEGTNGVNKG